jgi:DNA-binding GntR family transcriptional regulator
LNALIEREEHGAQTPQIHLPQSHRASMLGVSRQSLNAALVRLQERGLLRVSFRMIELVE